MIDFFINWLQYKYYYFIDIPVIGVILALILNQIKKKSTNIVILVLSKIIFFIPKTIYYFIIQFAEIIALHITSIKYKKLPYERISEMVHDFQKEYKDTKTNAHNIIDGYQDKEKKEIISFFNYMLKKITLSISYFIVGVFFTIACYHYYPMIKNKQDALNYIRIHYLGHENSINISESNNLIPTTREVDNNIMSTIVSFISLDTQWKDFLKSEQELEYPKLNAFFKVIKIIKNKDTNGLDYYQITFIGDIDQDGVRTSQMFLDNAPLTYRLYNKNSSFNGEENYVCDFKIIQKIDMQTAIEKDNIKIHEFTKDDLHLECNNEDGELKSQIYKILTSHTRSSQLSLYAGLNEMVCNNIQIRYIISLNFNERLYQKYKEQQKPYAKARDALKSISDKIQSDALKVDYCNKMRNGEIF